MKGRVTVYTGQPRTLSQSEYDVPDPEPGAIVVRMRASPVEQLPQLSTTSASILRHWRWLIAWLCIARPIGLGVAARQNT